MRSRVSLTIFLCLWAAASAGAQELLEAVKAAYSHLDWLGPDSWIRTVVRGLQTEKK